MWKLGKAFTVRQDRVGVTACKKKDHNQVSRSDVYGISLSPNRATNDKKTTYSNVLLDRDSPEIFTHSLPIVVYLYPFSRFISVLIVHGKLLSLLCMMVFYTRKLIAKK